MDRAQLAYKVAEIVLRELPSGTPPEIAERITAELALLVEAAASYGDERPGRRLIVVTAIGKNHAGIVHGISEVLAELEADIVDINQTLVRDNFAMMMVVDPAGVKADFSALKQRLKERGDRMGIQVFVQYEDLMRAVNRV